MAKSTVSVVRPSASDVRAFYVANPARTSKFSPEALHTLREGAKGRLHKEVIAGYNKGRKPERQYVLGVGKAKAAESQAVRKAAVDAGFGKRGPLSKAAQVALGLAKA